jgi:release factor glutamine methyltransferase
MSNLVNKPVADYLQTALLLAKQANIDEKKVKLLLAEVLQVSLPELPLHYDRLLSESKAGSFRSYIRQLMTHKPVQYILQKAWFYGLELFVNEEVLIPRPETEGLVEWVLAENATSADVLDIGTGSGCIALALKANNPSLHISAVDNSPFALQVAMVNARQLQLDIQFYQKNYYPHHSRKYDILVSNPPYISSADYLLLPAEVRDYEPQSALAAGRDGLADYRKIISRAAAHTHPHSQIYLEIGEQQAAAITAIAHRYGYQDVVVKQDLTGRDRYLRIKRD